MLELCNLHSFYGEAHVVCGASLTVAKGEVVALLGRNGMGKTTLIRSIMGLTPPRVAGGDVRWRGETLLGLRPMTSPHAASPSSRKAGACSRR
jgi:branched-chain amino acid transport system ATP-binding protein